VNTRPSFSDRLEALSRLGPEIKIELSRIAGIDPLNSRKIEPSDIDRMAANLRAQGQINPIVLRPDKGHGELFVLAGGRRFLALQKLQAESGPAIEVKVKIFTGSGDEARLMSLAENSMREDLHRLDHAEAIAETVRECSIGDIARAFGLSKRQVEAEIALAALSDKVKEAWRANKFGVETARAFTVAKNHAAMDAVLDAPDAGLWLRAPLALRKRFLDDSVSSACPAARFVTLKAYFAAGGTSKQDFFLDEERLTDPELLARLEEEKLAQHADEIRRAEGWGVLIDPAAASGLRRVPYDFRPDTDALEEIDNRLGDDELTNEDEQCLLDEQDRIVRNAALRAVSQAERHKYGFALRLDSEGRLVVDRALILATDADVPAAGAGSPLPAEGRGIEEDWGDASGLSDAAFASAAARAVGARIPSSPTDDAPLPGAARRIGLVAETKAIADVIAGDPRFAKELYVVACARSGPHAGPVGISRDHGPWNCKNPLLLAIAGAATYRERLALAAAASDAELDLAFCATVAMAGDLRDSTRRDDKAALRERAEQRLSPPPPIGPTMIARLVENFDYLGFFRAAQRQLALRALNDVGGVAMETGNSWRDHDDLAHEAAIVARAKRWLPEFLGGAPPPSSSRSPIAVSTK
jgi:ParB/RepB/Spo0J family partition protein